jgi:hypothetical protein
MIGSWRIKKTDEVMHVLVTANRDAFEVLINSHPGMTFLGWIEEKQ